MFYFIVLYRAYTDAYAAYFTSLVIYVYNSLFLSHGQNINKSFGSAVNGSMCFTVNDLLTLSILTADIVSLILFLPLLLYLPGYLQR
jgi:hypothetical protein